MEETLPACWGVLGWLTAIDVNVKTGRDALSIPSQAYVRAQGGAQEACPTPRLVTARFASPLQDE